jgi:Secretion system C-terminal sorting domain/SprB repeat
MKKIFITLSLFFFAGIAVASDLTFSVVNTSGASSTGSIDLTVTGGVAPYTYSWSGPAGYTGNTEDLAGLAAGTYTVSVTDFYCGIATYTVTVNVDATTGITEQINAPALLVYPNPGNGTITVSTGISLEKATLKVINALGQTIIQKSTQGASLFVFDISEQITGIYFIEVNNAGVISRTRFVKN